MQHPEYQIDSAFLADYYKDLVDEVGEIFQLFLQETPQDIENIRHNFILGNYTNAASLMHKIAPTFYNVGLPKLTAQLQAIEATVLTGQIDKAKADMQSFEAEFNNYLPAINKELSRLTALNT